MKRSRTDSVFPELRSIHSPDLPDMRHQTPEDPECFCVLVEACIGPKGEPGEEYFGFEVCTPAWLQLRVEKDGHVLGLHKVVVEVYDYEVIQRVLSRLCSRISGATWEEVVKKLGRHGVTEDDEGMELRAGS